MQNNLQVCSTSFGGGPVGDVSLWAAVLFCGGMMVFRPWHCQQCFPFVVSGEKRSLTGP